MTTLICDIETDGLDTRKCGVWLVCTKDIATGEKRTFHFNSYNKDLRGDAVELQTYLNTCDKIIGHNIINFDMRILRRVVPPFNPSIKVIDTLILSRLFNFYRDGGHSLEAYAKKLGGVQKVENEVWDKYEPIIEQRCLTDVEINHLVYKEMIKEFNQLKQERFDYNLAVKIEMKFAEHMALQETTGVAFDKEAAIKLQEQLTKQLEQLDFDIAGHLPPKVIRGKENYKVYLKNGEYAADIKKYWGEDYQIVQGPFTKISWSSLNLNSSDQVKSYLFSLGWEPDTWNYKKDKITKKPIEINGRYVKTSPQITIESLETLKGVHGEAFKQRAKSKHRLDLITGLLEKLRDDGRLSAEMNTLGAATSRTTHRIVTNIPKNQPEVFLGKECRSLFIASPGRVLVGCDASALEARIFAHYINDYLFTKELLDGDIHSINRDIWNLPKTPKGRQLAKNGFYALIYGAGKARLKQTMERDAETVRQEFEDAWPAYKILKNRVDIAARRGYIKAIDGRKVPVKVQYKALNYLIQSADSIIMKYALCLARKKAMFKELPVINMHDEFVFETSPEYAESVGKILKESIIEAGKFFNLNCPLDGEYKISQTWAGTH